MRKIFFAAILSLVTVLCVSATVAEFHNADSMDLASSVTVTIAGDDEEIDFETKTLVAIYNLMPQKVKDLCTASYKDIAPRIEEAIKQGVGMVVIPGKEFGGVFFKSLVANDLRSFGYDVQDADAGDMEIRW